MSERLKVLQGHLHPAPARGEEAACRSVQHTAGAAGSDEPSYSVILPESLASNRWVVRRYVSTRWQGLYRAGTAFLQLRKALTIHCRRAGAPRDRRAEDTLSAAGAATQARRRRRPPAAAGAR